MDAVRGVASWWCCVQVVRVGPSIATILINIDWVLGVFVYYYDGLGWPACLRHISSGVDAAVLGGVPVPTCATNEH